MRMNDAYPSKYLKAEDLEDGDVVFTIDDATFEEFTNQQTQMKENKPVLHFRGDDTKPLVLNKTNYKAISEVLKSDDTDDWAGQQIALYATEVESFGKTVLGIRVRLKAPQKAAKKQAKAAAVETPDVDDIPF